jgi:hypothetical protein
VFKNAFKPPAPAGAADTTVMALTLVASPRAADAAQVQFALRDLAGGLGRLVSHAPLGYIDRPSNGVTSMLARSTSSRQRTLTAAILLPLGSVPSP